MGSYTAQFGKIVIRPEHRQFVNINGKYGTELNWDYLRKHRMLRNHPDVKRLLADERYDSLGRMSSTAFNGYEFEDYSDVPNITLSDYIDHRHPAFDTDTNTLLICTVTKNYTDLYSKFVNVLLLLASDWRLYEINDEAKYDCTPTTQFSLNLGSRKLMNCTVAGGNNNHDGDNWWS